MNTEHYTPPTEEDVLLGHGGDNDGIEEYDNQLPTWWVWLFYATIGAGVWVFLDWHVISPKSLVGLYEEESAVAAATYPTLVPAAVVLDEAAVAAGAALYAANCVACHAADGTGNVGPNLTDATWVNGGTPEAINTTIFFGVAGRGMIGWGPLLGAREVASLAAYVHSLGGGE